MTEDRRRRGSKAHRRSLSGRHRGGPQSCQQDPRIPRAHINVDTITEEIGRAMEYSASHMYLYSYQDPAEHNPTYTQSSSNMAAIPTTAPSSTPTEASYSGTARVTPSYAYAGLSSSPSAGTQAEGDTVVEVDEPTSANSDPRLPNRLSDFSGSVTLASHSALTPNIDSWSGTYPPNPSYGANYSSVAFGSGDADSYSEPPPCTQVGDTSIANRDTSIAPSSGAEVPYDENNALGIVDMSDQGQHPYGHPGYRRGSDESMQPNRGSVVSLFEQTTQGDPVAQYGGEQARSSNRVLQQGVIATYVNGQAPWSPMNLDNRDHVTNFSYGHDDIGGFSQHDWNDEPN
ncbi:hypothetical protein F5Y05DRAFT_69501 [Hypoxylon sp. FL0543]|nr:hypothetical protein F5Y05DRAFT_69501 [Hypoxylon sp. FL0543]